MILWLATSHILETNLIMFIETMDEKGVWCVLAFFYKMSSLGENVLITSSGHEGGAVYSGGKEALVGVGSSA